MEPKIKTYGLNEALDLSFFQIEFNASRMAQMGLCLTALDDLNAHHGADRIHFEWALIQCAGRKRHHMGLLFKNRWSSAIRAHFQTHAPADDQKSLRVTSPVEALYFHGPHFGDRHGIADAAFQALKENEIDLIGAGCSGSSVYLLFPENGLKKARPVMGALFETPT